MKQTIIFGAAALTLTTMGACSNQHEPQNTLGEFQQVTINAKPESCTRAEDATAARFAISVWEDDEYETPANIFTGETNLITSSDGHFTLTLNTKKEYHCLLWADDGEGYQLGTTLKDVTVADGKEVSEAFHGKLDLSTGRTESYSVTLTRAVAHFSLLETGVIPAGYDMSFSWSLPPSFNVASEAPTGNARTASVSWTSETVSGTSDSPATLKDGIYVLASKTTSSLHTFTFRCNDEEPVEISNVPIRANYKTKIKGHFTTTEYVNFIVSHKTGWEDEEGNSEL